MPALNEHFLLEATDFMRGLERSLERATIPDIAELHRATRGLRGTAQMARDDRIYRAASSFENATRALIHGRLTWSDDLAQRARATAADLRVLLEGTEDEAQLEARADAAAARWSGNAAAHAAAEASGASNTRDFREFAAREVAGIAEVLERGLQELMANPMNREPLKAVLRRQRALLGSARLDEISVVAEILRAMEDLTGIIARLDVGVKKEWLDVYRVAREGLRATIDPLRRGDNPQPTHALSRLRHMRSELLERYGKGESTAGRDEEALFRATAAQLPTADATPAMHVESVRPAGPPSSRPAGPSSSQPPRAAETTPPAYTPASFPPRSPPPPAASPMPPAAAPTAFTMPPRASAPAPSVDAPASAGAPHRAAPLSAPATPPQQSHASIGAAPPSVVSAPVPIEELSYRGEAALRRALELREVLTRATSYDHRAAETLDELFDLIRLALG